MTASEEQPPHRPEDESEQSDIGAEDEGSADTPPPAPSEDDDSPLGDTDQHSVSDA